MTTEQLQWAVLGLGVVMFLVFVLMIVLLVVIARRSSPGKAGRLPGQNGEMLAPVMTQVLTQLAELQRSIALDDSRRTQEEQTRRSVSHIENLVTALNQLPSSQQLLTEQLTGAVNVIAEIKSLQEQARQRWDAEDKAHRSLERLNAVMLGAQAAGAMGENVVANLLSPLPAQWMIIDHTVDGRPVEFAVKLPDGYVLPIDSKMVAQEDLVALDAEHDQRLRASLAHEIQRKVLKKAEEVHKYVDEHSVGFALMALTDAAYGVAGSALSEAYQKYRVLLIPFSLLAPFALMIYEQHRHGGDIDTARLSRLVEDAHGRLSVSAEIVNGHLSTAVTMVTNARDRLSGELSAAVIALEQVGSANATLDAPRDR